jgi:hypothetical protein
MGRGERITLPIEHLHICLRDSAAVDLIFWSMNPRLFNGTIRNGRAYSWSLGCGELGLLFRAHTYFSGSIYFGDIDNARVPYLR